MVLIIGTGAGGSLLSMELALANIPVTIIEQGPLVESKEAYNYYDSSDEGIDLLKTSCVGGSTIVSAGNGVRSLEDLFKDSGIDLSVEFKEMESLLNIHPLSDDYLGKGTKAFINSAKELNLNVTKMPKFIDETKCHPCGKCAFGCPNDAKWSGKDFINVAIENGAELLVDTKVIDLIVDNHKIKGVEVETKKGVNEKVYDNLVILSAGAISSAILLQKVGLPAGQKLFTDPFVTVGGVLKGINYKNEVQMNALVKGKHFILAPHYSMFIAQQLSDNIAEEDILSIMVKVPDEGHGSIVNGKVIKENTIRDVQYLAEGAATAGAILKNAGVDSCTLISTVFRSAHPGGTAAIGELVDTNLKSDIDGLYVCDASVLPEAPGAPPILTILALSKRLSKYLIKKLS